MLYVKCECGNLFKKKAYQMMNKSVNCGCKKSFLLSRGVKNKINSDPTFLQRRGKSYSNWCKNNPDKVKEQGRRHSEKLRSNPEKLAEQGRKHSQWYRDHPEYVAELKERASRWYEDNPDEVAKRSRKYISTVDSIDNYYKYRAEKYSSTYEEYRKDAFSYIDINDSKWSFIDHNDIKLLVSGLLKSNDSIRTKCPVCSEYASHRLCTIFNVTTGQLVHDDLMMCCKCAAKFTTSSYEQEIADYISTFYNGTLIRNSREVISPLELDLYYPDKNIAIEFNGDYWHDENHKPKDYHLNKYLQCKEKGIILVSIFESEWLSKKSEIQLYLCDLFNYIDNPISFNSDGSMMNNNYPAPSYINKTLKMEESYYITNESKVFTCGYSLMT